VCIGTNNPKGDVKHHMGIGYIGVGYHSDMHKFLKGVYLRTDGSKHIKKFLVLTIC